MKKFKSNVEIKSKVITKPMIFINIHRPPYIEKTEITYDQPYLEISLKANEPIFDEEKQHIVSYLLEKLCKKYCLENVQLETNQSK